MATAPYKKSLYMKEWMGQVDSSKEDSTFERMNSRPQLLSSNEMTH